MCLLALCSPRHPIHCILDIPTSKPGCRGRLWLGGEQASHDPQLLQDNGITTVLHAARKSGPPETLSLSVYKHTDGTALANGDASLDEFLLVSDQVLERLASGEGVLVCCKDGARKSATLATILDMRYMGWDAKQAENYVSTLRNVVCLSSVPAPSSERRSPKRPVDFLAENQGKILRGARGLPACVVLTPVSFRKKALELDFETLGIKPKMKPSKHRPLARLSGTSSFELVDATSGDGGFSTVSSQSVNSSSMESEESKASALKRMRPSEPKTPPLEFNAVDDEYGIREARAAKLKSLCADLEELNTKMVACLMPEAVKKEEEEVTKKEEKEPDAEMPQAPETPGEEAAAPADKAAKGARARAFGQCLGKGTCLAPCVCVCVFSGGLRAGSNRLD